MNFDKDFARELDEKCAQVDAHRFYAFLNNNKVKNYTWIDNLQYLNRNLSWTKDCGKKKKTKLTPKEQEAYVTEFFSKISKDLGDKSRAIFSRQDDKYKITYHQVKEGDNNSSSVGHSDKNKHLDFNLYFHGTLDDMRTLAHETSHAMSAHHIKLIDLIRSNAPDIEIREYLDKRKNFQYDCVGEIESHITEHLFNQFMLGKGLISEDDILDYSAREANSLINNLNLILEENEIISQLNCPVDFASVDKLTKHLTKDNNQVLLDRIVKMKERDFSDNTHGKYRFRYVVARLVSDVWIERYNECTNKQERQDMLDNFATYLSKTDNLTINEACQFLLGVELEKCAEEYMDNLQNNLNP